MTSGVRAAAERVLLSSARAKLQVVVDSLPKTIQRRLRSIGYRFRPGRRQIDDVQPIVFPARPSLCRVLKNPYRPAREMLPRDQGFQMMRASAGACNSGDSVHKIS